GVDLVEHVTGVEVVVEDRDAHPACLVGRPYTRATISPWGTTNTPSACPAHARQPAATSISSSRRAIPYATAWPATAEATDPSAHSSAHHRRSAGVAKVQVEDV